MNINRFMMGTKWLPQYNSRAKERGLSERPWVPMFFKKSRQKRARKQEQCLFFQLSSKKEFQKSIDKVTKKDYDDQVE